MKILKRLSIFLILLIVLFSGLMIPQGLVLAEESGEVVEETVTEEGTETEEETTPEEIAPETELLSTNPFDLITFKVTDGADNVLLETKDLKQFATKGGSELFYETMSVSIPIRFVANSYLKFHLIIDFVNCEKIENIETFSRLYLKFANVNVYTGNSTTSQEIRFSQVNTLSDVYDKNKETTSLGISPTYFAYTRRPIENASIEDQKGEILFYNNALGFTAGDIGAITFDIDSYVEIEKRTGEETLGGEKVENWLDKTGDKISVWINENTGVAIGGTSSIIVVIVICCIAFWLLRRKRR